MKIAYLVCAFPPYQGGIGNSAFYFARQAVKRGHQVKVFTPAYLASQRAGDKCEAELYQGLEVVRLRPWLKYGNAALLPQLICKLSGCDLVYLHYPFFGGAEIVWLHQLLHKKKIKLAIHYHMDVGGLSLLAAILSWPNQLIRDSLFKMAGVVSCASLDYVRHSTIAALQQKYPSKFIEIPFGVDSGIFTPAADIPPVSADLLNRQYGRQAGTKYILFVGGLDQAHYFKGINILLKAAAKLQITNYKLQIIGDGDLRSQYEEQAKQLQIANKIEFAGKVSEEQLIKYYQQADLLVLPSLNQNEAFGLVLLEAMACGLPLVASNLPGVRRVFADGVQGLLAEPGQADDLANKIELILNNDNKRKQMGLAGRQLVEANYSWDKAGERLEEVYRLAVKTSQ